LGPSADLLKNSNFFVVDQDDLENF